MDFVRKMIDNKLYMHKNEPFLAYQMKCYMSTDEMQRPEALYKGCLRNQKIKQNRGENRGEKDKQLALYA